MSLSCEAVTRCGWRSLRSLRLRARFARCGCALTSLAAAGAHFTLFARCGWRSLRSLRLRSLRSLQLTAAGARFARCSWRSRRSLRLALASLAAASARVARCGCARFARCARPRATSTARSAMSPASAPPCSRRKLSLLVASSDAPSMELEYRNRNPGGTGAECVCTDPGARVWLRPVATGFGSTLARA